MCVTAAIAAAAVVAGTAVSIGATMLTLLNKN
jgi:hypothetical protein